MKGAVMFDDFNIHNIRRPFVLSNSESSWMRHGHVFTVLCPLFIIVSLLTGCALPLPIQAASWVIDGVSYMVTKKSILDHGISKASGQDCAMFRIVTEGTACRDVILKAGVSEPVEYIEISEIPPPINSRVTGLGNEVQ